MHNHILNYELSEAQGSSKRMDARVKIVCAVTAILALMFFTHWQTALVLTAACIFIAALSHVKMQFYLRKLLYPSYIIAVISVIQLFTYGSTIIAKTPLLSLPIFAEGMWFGILIASRCIGAISVLALLTQTTPIVEIVKALAWFHVPSALLDITLLTLRCIFILSEEAETIHRAQESRCGYSKSAGYLGRLRNYAMLLGMLFVRSYNRAMLMGNAMISRCYKGDRGLFIFKRRPISTREALYGLALIMGLAILIIVDRLPLF